MNPYIASRIAAPDCHDKSQVVFVVEQRLVEIKIEETGIGRQLQLSLRTRPAFPSGACTVQQDPRSKTDGQLGDAPPNSSSSGRRRPSCRRPGVLRR